MTKLDISLPDDVKALADQNVARGRYPSLSEYVADLIRRDQEHANDEGDDDRTEAHLLERMRSGASQEMTDADFDRIRQRVEHQIRQRRAP